MIKYVLIKIEEITPELEAMQSNQVSVKETVKYTFADGIYGVLFIREYDNAYNLLRDDSLQLRSDLLNGFGYNPAYCGSLIVPVSLVNAGITVLL